MSYWIQYATEPLLSATTIVAGADPLEQTTPASLGEQQARADLHAVELEGIRSGIKIAQQLHETAMNKRRQLVEQGAGEEKVRAAEKQVTAHANQLKKMYESSAATQAAEHSEHHRAEQQQKILHDMQQSYADLSNQYRVAVQHNVEHQTANQAHKELIGQLQTELAKAKAQTAAYASHNQQLEQYANAVKAASEQRIQEHQTRMQQQMQEANNMFAPQHMAIVQQANKAMAAARHDDAVQRGQLLDTIQQLEARVMYLKKGMEELEMRNTTMSSRLENLQQENIDARTSVVDAQLHRDNLVHDFHVELSEKESRIKELEEEVERVKSRRERALTAFKDAEQSDNHAAQRLRELQEQNEAAEHRHQNLLEQLQKERERAIEDHVSQSTTSVHALHGKAVEEREAVVNLSEKIKAAEAAKKASGEQTFKHMAQLTTANGDLMKKQKEHKDAIAALKKEKDRVRSEHVKTLDRMSQEHKALQHANAALKAQETALFARIQKLESELAAHVESAVRLTSSGHTVLVASDKRIKEVVQATEKLLEAERQSFQLTKAEMEAKHLRQMRSAAEDTYTIDRLKQAHAKELHQLKERSKAREASLENKGKREIEAETKRHKEQMEKMRAEAKSDAEAKERAFEQRQTELKARLKRTEEQLKETSRKEAAIHDEVLQHILREEAESTDELQEAQQELKTQLRSLGDEKKSLEELLEKQHEVRLLVCGAQKKYVSGLREKLASAVKTIHHMHKVSSEMADILRGVEEAASSVTDIDAGVRVMEQKLDALIDKLEEMTEEGGDDHSEVLLEQLNRAKDAVQRIKQQGIAIRQLKEQQSLLTKEVYTQRTIIQAMQKQLQTVQAHAITATSQKDKQPWVSAEKEERQVLQNMTSTLQSLEIRFGKTFHEFRTLNHDVQFTQSALLDARAACELYDDISNWTLSEDSDTTTESVRLAIQKAVATGRSAWKARHQWETDMAEAELLVEATKAKEEGRNPEYLRLTRAAGVSVFRDHMYEDMISQLVSLRESENVSHDNNRERAKRKHEARVEELVRLVKDRHAMMRDGAKALLELHQKETADMESDAAQRRADFDKSRSKRSLQLDHRWPSEQKAPEEVAFETRELAVAQYNKSVAFLDGLKEESLAALSSLQFPGEDESVVSVWDDFFERLLYNLENTQRIVHRRTKYSPDMDAVFQKLPESTLLKAEAALEETKRAEPAAVRVGPFSCSHSVYRSLKFEAAIQRRVLSLRLASLEATLASVFAEVQQSLHRQWESTYSRSEHERRLVEIVRNSALLSDENKAASQLGSVLKNEMGKLTTLLESEERRQSTLLSSAKKTEKKLDDMLAQLEQTWHRVHNTLTLAQFARDSHDVRN